MVSAWPEPPFAKLAGVSDGPEAFALGGATTETETEFFADIGAMPVVPTYIISTEDRRCEGSCCCCLLAR